MNALPTNGRMSWRDAALVAAILMLLSIGTLYLPFHGYDVVTSDPTRAVYELIVFAFVSWITYFVSLTGLNIYAQKAQEKSSTT